MKRTVLFCALLFFEVSLYGQGWDAERSYANSVQEMKDTKAYLETWAASFEEAEAAYGELEQRYGSDPQKQEDLRYYKHVLTHIDRFWLWAFYESDGAVYVRRKELDNGIALTDERSKVFVTIGQWRLAKAGFQALLPVFERVAGEMHALLAEK